MIDVHGLTAFTLNNVSSYKGEYIMKAKKKGLIAAAIIFVVVCLLTIRVSAAEWITCSVCMAGPSGEYTYICLSDTASSPAFTKKWFVAPADRAKEMTAIALTAMTNNMKVIIKADDGLNLDAFYLFDDRNPQ